MLLALPFLSVFQSLSAFLVATISVVRMRLHSVLQPGLKQLADPYLGNGMIEYSSPFQVREMFVVAECLPFDCILNFRLAKKMDDV